MAKPAPPMPSIISAQVKGSGAPDTGEGEPETVRVAPSKLRFATLTDVAEPSWPNVPNGNLYTSVGKDPDAVTNIITSS